MSEMEEQKKLHNSLEPDPDCLCHAHRALRGEPNTSLGAGPSPRPRAKAKPARPPVRNEFGEGRTAKVLSGIGVAVAAVTVLLVFAGIALFNDTKPSEFEERLSKKYGKAIEAPESGKASGLWKIDGEKKYCILREDPLKLRCVEEP